MLTLPVMDTSFLSNSFPSTVCNTYQPCTEHSPDTTENLYFKLKHSLNSTAHAHKNYTCVLSGLEVGLVSSPHGKSASDLEIVSHNIFFF